MKTVVITVSRAFMKDHPNEGQPTNFKQKILRKIKQHTLRADEKGTWTKKIKEVAAGEAQLSIREWTGRPYSSPQKEIIMLTKDDGVDCCEVFIEFPRVTFFDEPDSINFAKEVAANDGLTLDQFWGWFGTAKMRAVMIHFTDLRYIDKEEQNHF